MAFGFWRKATTGALQADARVTRYAILAGVTAIGALLTVKAFWRAGLLEEGVTDA